MKKTGGSLWSGFTMELALVALIGLCLLPFLALDLLEDDWFFLALLLLYMLANALRRLGEAQPSGGRREGAKLDKPGFSFPFKTPLKNPFKPPAAAPKAEEPSAARRLEGFARRLTAARTQAARAQGEDSALAATLGGLAGEYRQTRRALLAGETGAEIQANRLRRLGDPLSGLAQTAAAAPESERGLQAAEALAEALERLSGQRETLSGMAGEAEFEANLHMLRQRLPPSWGKAQTPEDPQEERPEAAPPSA